MGERGDEIRMRLRGWEAVPKSDGEPSCAWAALRAYSETTPVIMATASSFVAVPHVNGAMIRRPYSK